MFYSTQSQESKSIKHVAMHIKTHFNNSIMLYKSDLRSLIGVYEDMVIVLIDLEAAN